MKILRPEDVTSWPEDRELTPEELAEAYRLARESLTTEDHQALASTSDCDMLMDDVLSELEAHAQASERKRDGSSGER